MPSHVVRRIAWGLTWRWLIVVASLNMQVPPMAVPGILVLLAAGLFASVWRRHDLLGSAWRLLLGVFVVNLGFWLGSPLLVPAITLAICVTIADLWWSIGGLMLEEGAADPEAEPTPAVMPQRKFASVATLPLPPTPIEPVRRRASRRRSAGGLRLLLAACLLLAIVLVTAPTIASTASGRLSTALDSIGQHVQQITAAPSGPAVATAPTPKATATPTPLPPAAAVPAPTDPAVALAPNGLCVSLPDGRYEVQLPNGQTIVVTTRHRAGCPDLATILKALQNAGGGSD